MCGVSKMFNTLVSQIEGSYTQANTYDDPSWVLLFIFLEAAITKSGVAPETLITALQDAATPTGKDIIRRVQLYLQGLMKRHGSERPSTKKCVIS
jgi:hypothetical protein